MKYLSITLLVLAISVFLGKQQSMSCPLYRNTNDAEDIIRRFLHEVYATKHNALAIAHQYISFEDSKESPSEFSTDKRYEIAAAHITLLREGKGISSFSSPLNKQDLFSLRIVPYNSLVATADKKLLDFETDTSESKHIYVAMKNDAIWKYFYVKENKIYSFDYLLKGEGGRVYFFAY